MKIQISWFSSFSLNWTNNMHSLWVSLKENVSCKSRRKRDHMVLRRRPERTTTTHDYYNSTYEPDEHHNKTMPPQLLFKPNYLSTWFYELNIGEQSRNVVEIIFLAALVKPSKQRRIEHVFKVLNPVEVQERFEEYRVMVKTNPCMQHTEHPRNSVDGNELLRFYGTTMACCGQKQDSSFSQCCRDPSCGVCRLISYNFDAEQTNNGIHLTMNSDALTDNTNGSSKARKGKKAKRAVVLCRAIAGEVAFGLSSNYENLVLRNPRAALPCFVIVFT